jgi:hypothetical protein
VNSVAAHEFFSDNSYERFYYYEYDTIRGKHEEIEQVKFEDLTRRQGGVHKIEEIETKFNEYVSHLWNTVDPILNSYLDFFRNIEN